MPALELSGRDEQPYIVGFLVFCSLTGDSLTGYLQRPLAVTPVPFRAPQPHVVFRWHFTVR